jgi:hypothetical protein
MRSRLRPYSFFVFIARRSGSRPQYLSTLGHREVTQFWSGVRQLAATTRVEGDEELEVAQLALRRCLYLVSEMTRVTEVAPEAAAMAGRSVVESALVGSYLALHRATGASAAGLMKRQRGQARQLRDYFLKGDMIGAIELLPEVSFISAPLKPALTTAAGTPDLRNICSLLDEREPFHEGKLATQLYYETYAALSNLIVHATPQSFERYRKSRIRAKGRGPTVYGPATTLPVQTLRHAVLPAIGGLCGCLARSLDMPADYYDLWLKEAGSVDGYEWSGSIVRTAAVEGLAELVELPSVYALNAAGFAIRALATLGTMINASSADQLMASSEIIDRARTIRRRPGLLPLRLLASLSLISRSYSPRASDKTGEIATGCAAEHPQALLASLALVYAGLWPDNAETVNERLDAFDKTAPHELGVLGRLRSQARRQDVRNMHKKWRDQVTRMP